MAASGPARPRKATGAALVWAVLPLLSVGCGAEADRGGVSPMEDQLGDPRVPWHRRDERREAEQTAPMEPTPAPKTSKE